MANEDRHFMKSIITDERGSVFLYDPETKRQLQLEIKIISSEKNFTWTRTKEKL